LKLSIHIGMGKTGSSAIQACLARSSASLRDHGVAYLGMWWDRWDASLAGSKGMDTAANLGRVELERLGTRILEDMRTRAEMHALEHFVFSNEALYGHTADFEPLYAYLAEHVDLEFVVFVREPRQWLASAYAQWGMRHKVEPGPIPTLAEFAAAKIGIYSGLRWWHRRFGERLVVRTFDPGRDAVADFVAAIGHDFVLPSARVYETPEPALLLLHAGYNATFTEPVLPTRFGEDVYDVDTLGAPLGVEQWIARHFDQTDTRAVVRSSQTLFDEIRRELGVDLLVDTNETPAVPHANELRKRLLDHLLVIVLRQARRISALEDRLAALERDTAEPT
jgi:hypothetical protein